MRIYPLLFLCCLLFSCQQERPTTEWFKKNGKIKVLSTTAMVDQIVKEVGGEAVDRIILIQGELDPHSYQLVKGDGELLSSAELIFYNGLGLEHGPSLYAYLLRHPHAISLGDQIQKERPDEIIVVDGQPDPHIWMDPALFSQTIPYVVEALSTMRPELASTFQEAGERYQRELLQANVEMRKKMEQIPADKRYLVTSHDAFNYFTRAYLADTWWDHYQAPEGLAPESQLSVADLQAILCFVEKRGIFVLFPESNVNADCLQKIAFAATERGFSVRLAKGSLYSDSMGSGSYLDMIWHNVNLISTELQNP